MKIKLKTRSEIKGAMDELNAKIYSEEFLNTARERPEYFTRKRTMPFPLLVLFMLNMIKSSIQTCLNSFFNKLSAEHVHMKQQSFSEARQKIKWNAFRELFMLIVDYIYKCYYDTWQGYRILAIDGTKIRLPNDPNLKLNFGTLGQDNTAATAQASALYDVLNDVIVDAQIAPLRSGERKLALMHLATLCKRPSFDKECVIFDRGYASFEMIEILKKRGISFIMRVKRKFNLDIDKLSLGDHTVVLCKRGHDDVCVRALKFTLPSGDIECLITDLSENSIDDFKAIYFMRWPIETKCNEIKNKLEIENFSGRTINAIRQDFFTTMLMSNIVSIACWEAQADVDKAREEKENKYEYQVNVNEAIGTLKDDFILALLETSARKRSKKVKKIIFLLSKSVSPKRPGRSLPRIKSTPNSKFFHNKKSNC
jgi:hypothetical protein